MERRFVDSYYGPAGYNATRAVELAGYAEHAIALHFMYYNFCKVHTSLKVTPAMAAGVATKLWEISGIVALIG